MQVPFLWPRIFAYNIRISFAYQTFAWRNSARNNAGVHVVIIGLDNNLDMPARLFKKQNSSLIEEKLNSINAYLVGGKNTIVGNHSKPLCSQTEMVYGSMPNDGGNLLLSSSEADAITKEYPTASKWIKPILGAQEFLNGKKRYCLWLKDATKEDIQEIPAIYHRVEEVRRVRLSSKSEGANRAASTPHLFWFTSHPDDGSYILVPKVSSERRSYIPIGLIDHSTISSDANLIIPNATLYEFGILTSEIHNDWMRAVAGRLESRYRYSATLVYNTFPWPDAPDEKKHLISSLAEEIILAREDYPDKTLAELYDPAKMPQPLLQAHKALDKAVEKLYRDKPFFDTSDRLEHLLGLYEKLISEEKKGAL
jgi:hypothetical protein